MPPSFYVCVVGAVPTERFLRGPPVALCASLLLTVTGYAQANGANCSAKAPVPFPCLLPECHCLLGLLVFHICSLHHLTAAGKRKLPQLEVGGLDCCSLLQRDFVFESLRIK